MPVTVPTHKFSEIRATLTKAVAVSQSNYTGAQKVYSYPGKVWTLEFSLATLTSTEAGNWQNFLDDLAGGAETFNFSVASVAPGSNFSSLTSVPFRLLDRSISWVKTTEGHYQLSFSAVEAITT
jgi:hypothetical protein